MTAKISSRTPPALVAVAAALTLAATATGAAPGPADGRDAEASASAASRVVASDTAASRNAVRFWEEVECVKRSRYRFMRKGGDLHRTATGARQRNRSWRRLTVFDGDDFYGERCELGNNNYEARTVFYREGQRRITRISLRLPKSFPLGAQRFQSVVQMKQAGPTANGGGTPVLQLNAERGRWRVLQSTSPGPSDSSRAIWGVRAHKGIWTRFSLDVLYSADPDRGRITISVDLNGDGDFKDRHERSRVIHTYTLKYETGGPSHDPFKPGDSLPSHLRAGIYHDSSIPCPRPRGCSIGIDNVQVLRP